MLFDIIVIGGSYASVAAAMQIALARRKVLKDDGGLRLNRFAETSHGFGEDGVTEGAAAHRSLIFQ